MVHPKAGRKSCEYFGGFNHLKTSDWNVLIDKNGKIDMESMGISNSIRLRANFLTKSKL